MLVLIVFDIYSTLIVMRQQLGRGAFVSAQPLYLPYLILLGYEL
jgi:hypothetical protein